MSDNIWECQHCNIEGSTYTESCPVCHERVVLFEQVNPPKSIRDNIKEFFAENEQKYRDLYGSLEG